MEPLPQSDQSLLVRTDYQNAKAWEVVSDAVQELPPNVVEFMAMLAMMNGPAEGQPDGGPAACHIVDDEAYADAAPSDLLPLAEKNGCPVLFLFDSTAADHPENAILVIDLWGEAGRSFRAHPSQLYWIESNLSISNCDWEDFANNVDADGVYRGDEEE